MMMPRGRTQDQHPPLRNIRHSVLTGNAEKDNEGECERAVFDNLILHLHPPTVPERTLRFTHTWGLGGMAVVLLILLTFTGILLMFTYEPFPGRAYDSMITLESNVWFGQFIRNIHYWSGNILILVAFLHLLRVFFTGAFHHARRLNWVIGLVLFFLVLFSNFSGYLLPWDQLAFWAITICTSMLGYIPVLGIRLQEVMRGGEEVGPATLSLFYTFHIVIIPACLFLLMLFHFWRVRRADGVVIPRSCGENLEKESRSISTIPNLVLRELVVALVLIAFILVCSLILDAPLESKANPGLSPNPTKAPWYFVGIQELLLHLHPLFAAWIVPALIFGSLIALPYLKYDSNTEGVWFCSQKGRQMGIVSAATALVVTPLAILGSSLFIDFTTWLPKVPVAVSNGLLPVTVVAAAMIGFYIQIKKRYAASNNEAIQSIFILLLVSYVVLTITGTWFRGAGMALTWPWGN